MPDLCIAACGGRSGKHLVMFDRELRPSLQARSHTLPPGFDRSMPFAVAVWRVAQRTPDRRRVRPVTVFALGGLLDPRDAGLSAEVTSGKLQAMNCAVQFSFSWGGTMIKKSLVNVGVAALLGGMAVAAQAAPLSMNLGFANGSANMTVGKTNEGDPNDYITASAGAFKGQTGATAPFNTNAFITYCVQLTQNFYLNTTYGDYSLVGGNSYFSSVVPALAVSGATVVNRLEYLFSSLGSNASPSSSTRSAAIQLAVWEAIYEGNNYGQVGGYLDGGGTFGATGTASLVISTAETILSDAISYAAGGGAKLFALGVLKNEQRQDFLVLEGGGFQAGVPEPTSLALAFGALGALGFATRRRKIGKS
jgi:hypothetical protein